MDREIMPIQWDASELDVNDLNDSASNKNIRLWFENQNAVGDEAWVIAYADDGVIWGKLLNGKIETSGSYSSFLDIFPSLRAITLQEARLFGEKAEVRVWREKKEFRAIRTEDKESERAEAFDEDYILWGTKIEANSGKFSLVAEGRQGLRHAVPLVLSEDDFKEKGLPKHPLRLRVRHYIDYDADGKVFVKASRLVKLFVKGGQQ